MKTNNQTNNQPKIFEVVKSALLDGLTDLDAPYTADIHHHLYNETEHFIYYAEADKAADELGIWECVGVVKEYEQTYSDECSTDLSDPVKVANMLVYIVGEALLNELFANTKYFDEYWDITADKAVLQEMLSLATFKFNQNPNLVMGAWYECIKLSLNLP